MNIYLFKMFGISLILTLVIELVAAKVLRLRMSKKNVYLIILVNLLTNPAAVFSMWIVRQFINTGWSFIFEVFVEFIVVMVEAEVYKRFACEENWEIEKPLQLAVVLNVTSWILGMILQL